ncbi:MAG: ribonuclease HII [Anaerolineae bacterium]|nr:ribonuclease HII [Anaerolineae bacterium]
MTADLAFEYALRDQGYAVVAGVDEAGRGAWAGPVVAGAVVLPLERFDLATGLAGVDDSKKLTPAQREAMFERICLVAAAVGVGSASPAEIDALGIAPATRLAMRRAVRGLAAAPAHLLVDYVRLPEAGLPCTALVKGDARSLSIAAASIVAKVSRDRLMAALDAAYPEYGFGAHKGYGTARHRSALDRVGPSPLHRRSFRPVAACAGCAPPVR